LKELPGNLNGERFILAHDNNISHGGGVLASKNDVTFPTTTSAVSTPFGIIFSWVLPFVGKALWKTKTQKAINPGFSTASRVFGSLQENGMTAILLEPL
jgi:hypothetical protein